MADSKRDELMRVVGQVKAATQILECVNVPPGVPTIRTLLEVAETTLRKAMLEAWSQAEQQPSERDGA